MSMGFECWVLDEIARGSKSPNPRFRSKAGALKFAEGYSGLGHDVTVVQCRNDVVIAKFRNGKKIG